MIVARALYAFTVTFATVAILTQGAPAALTGLLLCVGLYIALDTEVVQRRAGGAR